MAKQFPGLKVLQLPNAEISDFARVPGNHKKLDRAEQRTCFPRKNH